MSTVIDTGIYIYVNVGRIVRECHVTLAAGQPIGITRAGNVVALTMDSACHTRRAMLQAHTESGQRGSTASFVPGEAMLARMAQDDFGPEGRNREYTVREILIVKKAIKAV